MPFHLSPSRFFRATSVCVVALALTAPSLSAAETATERRLRMEQERKQKAQEKEEKRKAAAEEKQRAKADAAMARGRGVSRVIKLEEQGVQYTLMPGWQGVGMSGQEGLVAGAAFQDPQKSRGHQGTVMVRVLPVEQGKTLDDVVARVTKEFNCCGPHFKVEPAEVTKLGGETARTLLFEPREEMAKNQKMHMTAAQHGDRAYIFTLVTKADQYNTVRPDAAKMLKTVQWLGPKIPPTKLPPAPAPAAAVAAGPNQPPAGKAELKTYENAENQLRLKVPADWMSVSGGCVGSIFNFAVPPDFDSMPKPKNGEAVEVTADIFTVAANPARAPGADLPAAVDQLKAQLKTEVPGIEFKPVEPAKVAGGDAVLLTATTPLPKQPGKTRTDRHLVFLRGGKVFQLIHYAYGESGKAHVPAVERAIASFEWTGEAPQPPAPAPTAPPAAPKPATTEGDGLE